MTIVRPLLKYGRLKIDLHLTKIWANANDKSEAFIETQCIQALVCYCGSCVM